MLSINGKKPIIVPLESFSPLRGFRGIVTPAPWGAGGRKPFSFSPLRGFRGIVTGIVFELKDVVKRPKVSVPYGDSEELLQERPTASPAVRLSAVSVPYGDSEELLPAR
jgi:hypothetical protein